MIGVIKGDAGSRLDCSLSGLQGFRVQGVWSLRVFRVQGV